MRQRLVLEQCSRCKRCSPGCCTHSSHSQFQLIGFVLRKRVSGFREFLNQVRYNSLNPTATVGEGLGIASDCLLQRLQVLRGSIGPLAEGIYLLDCRQLREGRLRCQPINKFGYHSARCVTCWKIDSEAQINYSNLG